MTIWIDNSIDLLMSIKNFIMSPEIFKIFAIGAFIFVCDIVRRLI